MLPELSLSWRFIKPVRGLLVFLIILLASFVSIGMLFWQTAQSYQQRIPVGAATNNYYAVGFDQLSQIGRIDECMVDQIIAVDGVTNAMFELEMFLEGNLSIIGDTRTLAISPDDIQTAGPNFLNFFGVEPIERFYDHQQLYPERWAYVNEDWWQQHKGLAKDVNGYPTLALNQEFSENGQPFANSQSIPIAGVLPANFHPYQDMSQPQIIVSNGMSFWWPELQPSGSFKFTQPQAPGMRDYWWARLMLTAEPGISKQELSQRINQTLLNNPAPCVAGAYAFRKMLVMPGTRTDLAAYEKQGESLSLLSLIMIALGFIVVLYTLAFAQRLQSVRQQEFLLKVAMGGSPNRIAKQILLETGLMALVAMVLAVAIYLPLNNIAETIGFAQATQWQVWPWLILLSVVSIVGFYVVLTSRKVADPEYVYQGLNNLRHKIQHKFWWMQLNHTVYLVVLAIAVLIMGLISSAYWRQLAPNDVLSKSEFKVLVEDWRMPDGKTETFSTYYGQIPELTALLRNHKDDLALQCGNYDVMGMKIHGQPDEPATVVNSIASDSFFEHVLNLGPIEGRNAFITEEAAKALNISSDARDISNVRIANVPRLDANGNLQLAGRQGVQRVLPPMSMPNVANAPIMYLPKSIPFGCGGILWVSPEFNARLFDTLEYQLTSGERLGYRLLTWREFMTLEQEVAVQRLRLVVGLSALALMSLFAIVLLNTSYLFQRMQPWYWLNIAQGMPPRTAKIQTQLRIGVMSAVALLIALVIAVFGFYEFFPLVSQWLPRRDALNISVVATVLILVMQQLSLWWCARTLNNKDMSAWQG